LELIGNNKRGVLFDLSVQYLNLIYFQWIDNTVAPHFDAVKQQKNLPANQKACLSVDMWPIHTAKTDDSCFLPWAKEEYPWLAVIFVPGGCTSQYLYFCSSELNLTFSRYATNSTSRCQH
jgi:hypothetical protein